jgi:hypothetical protein
MKIRGFGFYGWQLFFGKIVPGQYAIIGDVPKLSKTQMIGIGQILAGTHHAKRYGKRAVKESLTSESLPGAEG